MLVVKLAGTQAISVSPNLVRRAFPLASHADVLRGSYGAGTRDESSQPRSQGSLLPVPTERVSAV